VEWLSSLPWNHCPLWSGIRIWEYAVRRAHSEKSENHIAANVRKWLAGKEPVGSIAENDIPTLNPE
jgi:hypothetical protein